MYNLFSVIFFRFANCTDIDIESSCAFILYCNACHFCHHHILDHWCGAIHGKASFYMF